MGVMTREQYAYDESLRDCFHPCIRCEGEAVHEAPAGHCEAVILCGGCEIDTKHCFPYRCDNILDPDGAHHWRCPNRDLEEV